MLHIRIRMVIHIQSMGEARFDEPTTAATGEACVALKFRVVSKLWVIVISWGLLWCGHLACTSHIAVGCTPPADALAHHRPVARNVKK